MKRTCPLQAPVSHFFLSLLEPIHEFGVAVRHQVQTPLDVRAVPFTPR